MARLRIQLKESWLIPEPECAPSQCSTIRKKELQFLWLGDVSDWNISTLANCFHVALSRKSSCQSGPTFCKSTWFTDTPCLLRLVWNQRKVGESHGTVSREQSGAAEACWAHNPEVDGSKPSSANYTLLQPARLLAVFMLCSPTAASKTFCTSLFK